MFLFIPCWILYKVSFEMKGLKTVLLCFHAVGVPAILDIFSSPALSGDRRIIVWEEKVLVCKGEMSSHLQN
jgi:hypothetical protein